MQTPPLLTLLVALLAATPVAHAQVSGQVTPEQPIKFVVSPYGPAIMDFEIVVPKSATSMSVWTTDATDDISLSVESFSDDWGPMEVHGPDIWLDESLHLSVADGQMLFPGIWTVHVSLGNASIKEGFPTSTTGTLHVSFPEPLRTTLEPGLILETELTVEEGYRSVLSLPSDWAPERKSQWLVEAYSPKSDIDLVVGPSAMPQTLDYPYCESQRAINYERCTFQGRQAKDLAIHAFGFMDTEESEPIPLRVRLTEVRPGHTPESLLPPLELPKRSSPGATKKSRAIDSTLAIFGPLGGGSGTLLSSTGLVLTNAHVAVSRPANLTLGERKKSHHTGFQPTYFAGFQRNPRRPVVPEVSLELIASREDLDLALLRITTTLDNRPLGELQLPEMSWGDPEKLLLGDPLFALGFPMTGGLGTLVTITLTSGICSGFGQAAGSWSIKTDAGVHAGISGGALLNGDWQLVGIPASSIADANYAGGIGYAIPVTAVPEAWRQLAGREDLDRVIDALNAKLPGDIKVFPGSTALEWALLRADAAALSDGDAAAGTRLVEAGAAALGPLLAEVSSKDLSLKTERSSAARLCAALDTLMLGHGPKWQCAKRPDEVLSQEELEQAIRSDKKAIEVLAGAWKEICERPERWAELTGLRDGTHPTELTRFEELLGD